MKKIAKVIRRTLSNGKFEYLAADVNTGTDYTVDISDTIRKRAYEAGNLIEFNPDTGKWNRISGEGNNVSETPEVESVQTPSLLKEQLEAMSFIKDSYKIKPKQLQMNQLKWQFLVRSVIRGKNIMMTGPAGSGKTMAAKAVSSALNRPDFYFNLGATQDPRTTLIGNTQFKKDSGTYFSKSLFVKAIQTENAVILLDELSRAHPEAWNILMTVLDQTQRYLRLDEQEGTPTIKVAPGVSFIATANIGNEYTATRTLDRALSDRFTIIEMDPLDKNREYELLKMMFPMVNDKKLRAIADIADITRKEVKGTSSKIRSAISTRLSVETASLLFDGFKLSEAAEVAILPFFDEDGGAESERTFIKQVLQKYSNVDDAPDQEQTSADTSTSTDSELFTKDDIS